MTEGGWQNPAESYWNTALKEIGRLDRGDSSILESGSIIERAITNMAVYDEYTDDFWTGLADWCFANIAPHVVAQGPEFTAWMSLTDTIVQLMPDEVKNKRRG